ncbi:MAG: DNA topoisomerase IV subunit A [Alphaproteobacteria bacterium]|nr:DNA topoisomerase IV subunit A [Alphaproteobacteria bacterium]
MTEPAIENIQPVAFTDALSERYLSYAMSTIMSRSLPDVRDGLKPVHRRLLYAMLQLKLKPDSGFKKCARVVGDVIGKYHPHGDVAVYDTMVRLAQSFSVRYPLVEGQGNFGSIDGDNAAAMRYTEARLTEVAMAMLDSIEEDTVDFRDTYDGSEQEPVLLPAGFPNLLANGSEGIAVGMATSIPPHNVAELADALIHLIKHPAASIETLVGIVKGPDFPTGGVIVESHDALIKVYESGRGSIRVRAQWEKEELSHGLYQIVITEIPYQVQKSRLIEKLASLFKAKRLSLLGNIRDESSDKIRIILEPRSRSVDPQMLMESVFKLTELENRFNLNMNVLGSDGVPRVMDLREVLQEYLDHRMNVLVRKANNRLRHIDHRLEVLGGLLIAYLNLDEVIRIIREEEEPKQVMMAKWGLSDVQVEAILNMRLRSLKKLEEMEIRREHDALSAEKDSLITLLGDEALRWQMITKETKKLRDTFGSNTELGKRRTIFAEAPTGDKVLSIEAFVEKEAITILYSEKGWIRAIKGHSADTNDIKYKEGDQECFVVKTYTTDYLLVFSSDGRFHTIQCDRIQKGKGYGEPLRLLVDIPDTEVPISMFPYQEDMKVMVASEGGKGFVVPATELLAQTKNGKQILVLGEGDRALVARPLEGNRIAVIGTNRKMLIFETAELPEMKRGQGVKLQQYKQAHLSDMISFNVENGLSWRLGDRTRTETDLTAWFGKRGTQGRMPPVGFPRDNKF